MGWQWPPRTAGSSIAALANNDAAKMVEQVQLLLVVEGRRASSPRRSTRRPSATASRRSCGRAAMSARSCRRRRPRSSTRRNIATGKALADAAAAYIKDKLGGKANVVLLTQDQIEFLAPRFAAFRDGLKEIPGVTIVADITPNPVNKEGGFATMSTILQAHPDVDVVLGADTVVLGALAALEAAGKARPDQFLGGIDGEPEAVAEIKKGTAPTRPASACLRRSSATPWGSTPPTGSKARASRRRWTSFRARSPTRTSRSTRPISPIPAAVYADPARRDAYLKMYGNICYDTRDQYVNFPWSSETK